LQSARRDVVLDRSRGLVRFWFSREALSHLVVFPGESGGCTDERR